MDIAEENIQARIRGNIWMALTNKFGGIVLTAKVEDSNAERARAVLRICNGRQYQAS